MHNGLKRYSSYLFAAATIASLILLSLQQWHPAFIIWLIILSQMPAIFFAFNSKYLSIKVFCGTTLITQLISAPVFYLDSERYAFGDHRPFSFNISDALQTIFLLALFQFSVAIIFTLLWRLKTKCNNRIYIAENTREIISGSTSNARISKFNTYCICILIIFSLPMKFLMFNLGIGIVGAPPPRLPFHLTGILTYFFSWIVPLLIGYLYIKTKRSSILFSLLISLYALMIGLLSSSKAVVLLIICPIVVFAWIDRRWTITMLCTLIAGLGSFIVESSRSIVHISDMSSTMSFTDLGGFGTLFQTLSNIEWSLDILRIFISISGRIESFQGLYMASEFNADAVGGSIWMFLKAVNNSWVDLGHDSLHLEFLGYTIPSGFYGIPASLNAWMMMASNKQYFMVLLFALYASFVLSIIEILMRKISSSWGLSSQIYGPIVVFLTILFYTSPGGRELWMFIFGLFVLSFLSKYRNSYKFILRKVVGVKYVANKYI